MAITHTLDDTVSDGVRLVIEAIHRLSPGCGSLRRWRYNGPNLRDALARFGDGTIEIVDRTAEAAGFQPLPRGWVVERTLAWLNRNRRLAKDFSVQLLIRRLA